MKLRFPYSFHGLALSVPARPILETWRPFASGCLVGKEGASWQFRRALLDTGSDDTVFPLSAVELGIVGGGDDDVTVRTFEYL